MAIFEELKARGLVRQSTGEEHIAALLDDKEPLTFYIGFDPTANSLHVGHLLQLITVKRLIHQGHKFIALVGGATAMIGDISGKNDTRKVLSADEVAINAQAIKTQIQQIVQADFMMVNNHDWFKGQFYLDFVREIGSLFSVNQMLRAECFRARLESKSGLSFLEFNYMLMQGFDFLHLRREHGCILQLGGDDQWSNILAGIDLIHKKDHKEAFGLTLSLLLNSTGEKMGKTLDGAIWLDANKTKPFEFFQYWRNIPDADVGKCFQVMTFVSMEEIEGIMRGDINEAKKRLAWEITALVHGKEAADRIMHQAQEMFEHGNNTVVEVKVIKIVNGKTDKYQVLVELCLAVSKTQARQLVAEKAIKWQNGGDITLLTPADEFPTDKGQLTIFKGKKTRIGCKFIDE